MAKVEAKVTAGAFVGLLVGGLITVLNLSVADAELLGSWPAWLQSLFTLLVPPVVQFLGGYSAPHTPRPVPVDDGSTPGYSR